MLRTVLRACSFLLLGSASPVLLAQTGTGVVRGTVSDERSGLPLASVLVEVVLADTVISTATDAQGRFRVDTLPVGIHPIRVSLAGFESTFLPEVWVRTGKEEVLEVVLAAAAIELAAGEVVRFRSGSGVIPLTVEQTLRYPAGFYDPARVAATFAGVAATNDQANHMRVRGNNPNANAWLLEGAEMVNPNHLSNAGTATDLPTLSGGGVNILSAQMLGNSRLLKGSLTPDRGNALGGVMDMELRKGNTSAHEWTAQAGLLGLDLSTEGPLGKGGRSSYLVNYRYSTIGLLSAMGVDLGDEAITFQDLSFHLTLPLGAHGDLRFFGLGGNSSNVFEAPRDTSEWEFDKDGSDITYTARTGAGGTTLRLPVGEFGSFSATVLISATDHEREEIRLDSALSPSDTSTFELREQKLSTVARYEGKLGNRVRLGIGASAMERSLTNLFEEDVSGWLLRPHANVRWYISDHWVAGIGMAYAHFTYNGSEAVEPRASLQWNIRGSRRLTASVGRRSQLPMHQLMNVHFTDDIPWNEELGMSISDEAVIAYDHPVNERLTFHVEVYHQQLSDVPELDPMFDETGSLVNNWDDPAYLRYLNTGNASNTGMEVSTERTFAKNFFYQVNATVYDSRYTMGGKSFDTRWNGTYIFNAVGGKEFVKKKEDRVRTWGITGRVVVMGGARYTPVVVRDFPVPTGPAWSEQFDAFHRLDLRFYLKRERKGRTGMWALDLQNALNVQNEAYNYYDFRKGEVVTKYQLGLIPNLSYRIEF